MVIDYAFGTFLAKVSSVLYPEKIPAIVAVALRGIDLPTDIAKMPFITGNTSLPIPERLKALQMAFFAPNHDAHIWIDGCVRRGLRDGRRSTWCNVVVPYDGVVGESRSVDCVS
ncbi:hypothetical protein N7465_011460 [Penicillium sp. CMV-2018d]|nr:hypothetical protein N7465_011460 [Penicillium sp. CMV-2018d]